MWKRSFLLSPDESAGGGSAGSGGTPGDAGQASMPSTSAPPPNQMDAGPSDTPAQQPSGRFLSDAELTKYQRYEQQVRASNDLFSKVKQRGLSSEEVLNQLDEFGRIKNDPTLTRVLGALRTDPNAGQRQQADMPIESLTPESIVQLVRNEFQTQHQTVEAQRHQEAAQQETSMLDHLVSSDERFKSVFQKEGNPLSFEAAITGDGGRVSQAMATLIDVALMNKADKYPNGQPKPITDSQMLREVLSDAHGMYEELKAQTIMAASSPSPGGVVQQNTDHVVQRQPESDDMFDPNYVSPAEKRHRDAEAHMAQLLKQTMKGGRPTSHSF